MAFFIHFLFGAVFIALGKEKITNLNPANKRMELAPSISILNYLLKVLRVLLCSALDETWRKKILAFTHFLITYVINGRSL